LSKVEGVNDCVKFIIQKIKNEQEILRDAKKAESDYGFYEDCGDYYREKRIAQQAKVDVLIEVKISLEKYKTKLKKEILQAASESLRNSAFYKEATEDELEEMSKGG